MLKILLVKLREALWSVLPVTAIVTVLSFTPLVSLEPRELIIFLICSVLLVVGIALFNLGADMAMTPMGVHVGSGLSKSGRVWLLLSVCFALGVLITVAEPDLSVLATQVEKVIDPLQLILFVGVGVGLFLFLAVLKIVAKVSLSRMLLFFYMILFAFASLMAVHGNQALLPLSFDSGGVTTGPITVPFIMALGTGIANAIGGKDANENSFGLVALCSVGPILAVMMLGAFATGIPTYEIPDYAISAEPVAQFFHTVLDVMSEVGIALGLIVAFFLVLQVTCLRLPHRKISRMAVGILYTFFGLVIFLAAVTIGFMPIGYKLGVQMAEQHPAMLVVFGFLLGLVVVLAEPAVQVLNKQVEEITSGMVSKRSMTLALSIGVGISIGLSMLRIIFDFSILYYLIPGYVISLGLSFFVPKLYTAIAFDSGGVASGPLTSGFILPLAVGACSVAQPNAILSDAFGIVAMVAMTPLITIQVMGFRAIVAKKVKNRAMMKNILDADDEQIIDFM